MSEFLTRDEILGLQDLSTKVVTVPDNIPVWAGKKFTLRQLNRGQQDEYLKRQFGNIRMKQDKRANNQEIVSANMYGHDAWLCIHGLVDQDGKQLFTMKDEQALLQKSGEPIGWLAAQIIEFSGMKADIDEQKRLEETEQELKN